MEGVQRVLWGLDGDEPPHPEPVAALGRGRDVERVKAHREDEVRGDAEPGGERALTTATRALSVSQRVSAAGSRASMWTSPEWPIMRTGMSSDAPTSLAIRPHGSIQ